SPDSKTLAAIGAVPGRSLYLWDVASKKPRTLAGHDEHVLGVTFHPEGNRVATVSADGTARLWETAPVTGRSHRFPFRGAGSARTIAFSPSGRHLAVGLDNGAVALVSVPPLVARKHGLK